MNLLFLGNNRKKLVCKHELEFLVSILHQMLIRIWESTLQNAMEVVLPLELFQNTLTYLHSRN